MFKNLVKQNMTLSVALLGGESFYIPSQNRTINGLFDNPLVPDTSMGTERLIERPSIECSESELLTIKKGTVIVRVETGKKYSVLDYEKDKTNGAILYLE